MLLVPDCPWGPSLPAPVLDDRVPVMHAHAPARRARLPLVSVTPRFRGFLNLKFASQKCRCQQCKTNRRHAKQKHLRHKNDCECNDATRRRDATGNRQLTVQRHTGSVLAAAFALLAVLRRIAPVGVVVAITALCFRRRVAAACQLRRYLRHWHRRHCGIHVARTSARSPAR